MESGYKILEQILRGGSLKDKLTGAGLSFSDLTWENAPEFNDALVTPGRDALLKPREHSSSAFPKKSEMKSLSARGRLLHFFANHELLAIETMALALLKFKDAPLEFRKGVFRTLQDEQRHLNSYLGRMEAYGVEFGGVPLNLFFWNTLKDMRAPIDFVSQMSLTFEQANLDFALEYAQFFETEMDDHQTAKLLREVHDDEVKHVAHGWKWFQEWRDPKCSSDFDAYKNALPYPMTPRRARGGKLFAEQSRLDAGLSAEFVKEVKIAGGSRGRVPHYYYFNPQCEIEGKGFNLTPGVRSKIQDLETLPLWLALEEDGVELSSKPDLDFLEQVHEVRGSLPEMITTPDEGARFLAWDEFRPWGFSESAWMKFDSLKERIRKPPLFSRHVHREKLYSKGFWKSGLGTSGWVIHQEADLQAFIEQAKVSSNSYLVKTSQSTSGRGHLRIDSEMLKDPALLKKLSARCSADEGFVIEPFFDKKADFSVQYEILRDGQVLEFPPRLFKIDEHFQYQGALLGQHWQGTAYEPYMNQVLKEKPYWREKHQAIIEILKSHQYTGPFGVDCMLRALPNGALQVEAVIEVNVRLTMGRVAQEIEKASKRGTHFKNGIWVFLGQKDLLAHGVKSFSELAQQLKAEYGPRFFPTTSAKNAENTWTFALMNLNSESELRRWNF